MPKDDRPTSDYSLEEILEEILEGFRTDISAAQSEPPLVSDRTEPEGAAFAAQNEEAEQAHIEKAPEEAVEAPIGEPAEEAPVGTVVERSALQGESVEGFEEHSDLYAATPETEESARETAEEAAPEPDEPKKKKKDKLRPPLKPRGLLRNLQGRLVAMLAVASYKREQQEKEPEPEPEDLEREMPALEAARLYAGQIPAFERRCKTAFVLSLLPIWLALGFSLGFPIPGSLGSDLRVASLVSLTVLLAVMLTALDVFTSGILSLFRGRPGAETLISLACLASAADCVYGAVAKTTTGALAPCALPCIALSLALLGSWLDCRGYRSGFLALHRGKGAFAVTSEQLLDRKEAFLIKSRRSLSGFIRRSEEPDGCESLSADMAPFTMVACLVLSVLIVIANGSISVFTHAFAVLTAVCAAWPALCALPLLFERTAVLLQRNGSALAGWSGARDMGVSRHLILTDSDLFPEGTVSLCGVRILEGVFTDKVVERTGSILAAAGTDLAALFTDLMSRSGGTMQSVEDFEVGEGGATGRIDGDAVAVGCAGYMHLLGIKISPKLMASDAVYTAFNGALVGIFSVEYAPTPSVAEALKTLQRSRRRPIFAVRDFNVDPKMIKERFHCSVDGFEFPSVPERFKIADVPSNGVSPVAGLLSGGGLGRLVELFDRGRYLYRCGLVCQILTGLCALLGLALAFLLCWEGNWAAVSTPRLLLYMLLWLLPPALMSLNIRQ